MGPPFAVLWNHLLLLAPFEGCEIALGTVQPGGVCFLSTPVVGINIVAAFLLTLQVCCTP